jgi:peptidyl-prolyl cis-trans isomerase C
MLHRYRPWLVAALLQMSTVTALAQEKVAPPVQPLQPAPATQPAPAAAPAPTPAAAPAPVPAAAPAPADNAVAATVNGKPIPEKAVRRALERGVPPDRWAQARQEILNYLIDNTLIDQSLTQVPITIEPKDVDARMEQIRGEIKKAGQNFDEVMKKLKLDEQELRVQIMADLRWDKYASTKATDAALHELFDKNMDIFDGSMVHARHILLSPPAGDTKAHEQAKAQLLLWRKQIEDQVAQGLAKLPATADNLAREKERARLTDEAFSAIARDKSACPSKAQGGDIGLFPRSGSMVEPFARAAFALKPYQMSDVVSTQFGYHLILVTERRPGKETKFESAKEEVKEVYYDRLREQMASQLRQNAKIVVNPAP